MRRIVPFFILLSIAIELETQAAVADETAVQTASHNALAPLPTAESPGKAVTFSQFPTQIGDRVAQRVGMELELRTVIKQSGQVANDSSATMRSRQEREIEVLEVADGQANRARVSYPLARKMSPENPQPAEEIAQVVQGKSYLVTRSGDQLTITDKSGAMPTREEFEIVLGSMENFGKPNPLAAYLRERTLHVGDTLDLPLEIAVTMMGFDKMGEVEKFEMRLDELRDVDGKECAVFSATIVTIGDAEAPLRVVASGSVAIELATTRTLEATLQGPVTMAAVEKGIQYLSTGELLLAVQSSYRTK